MNPENIIRLKIKDGDEVMCLIREAISEMEKLSIYQWDEVYPDYETILADIRRKEMFGVFVGGDLAGIVVLNREQSHEYLKVQWGLDDHKPLVMHRLCVRPKYQRQGIAKQLLDFTQQFALKNNYKSIRLDGFSKILLQPGFMRGMVIQNVEQLHSERGISIAMRN